MKLRPRNYDLDDSLSTDEAFNSLDGEDGYDEDDSLLRSAGGDAVPIKLTHTHSRFSDFQPTPAELASPSDEDDDMGDGEIEQVSLEEVQGLLGDLVSGEEDVG